MERAREYALRIDERFRRLNYRNDRLLLLMDAVRDIAERRSFGSLLATIVRRARALVHADVSLIGLYDDEGMAVRQDGLISPVPGLHIPADTGLSGHARHVGAPVWTPDYLKDENFQRNELLDCLFEREGLRAAVAIPLCTPEKAIGVLLCAHREVRSYSPDELSLMNSLAGYAASAVERCRALDEARARIARITSKYDRLRARVHAEQRAEQAGRRLLDAVLAGADAQAVTDELARTLSLSVALRDENDLTLAVSGRIPAEGDALDEALLEARVENRATRAGDDITVLPVTAGDEDLGALIVHSGRPLDESDHAVATHAARASAVLALVNRRAAAQGQARDEALDALLDRPGRDPQRTAQLTQRLGVDLARPHVVVVAHAESGRRGRITAWASRHVSLRGGAKTLRDGCLVLLLPGDDPGAAAREVSRRLGQALNHSVTAGGAPADGEPDSVANGYRQAKRCVEALTSMDRHGAAATAEELGFVGMLLGGNRDVRGFIDRTIGPVLDYDEERSTELAGTLEAYFAAGGSPTYAADALQVHPNTVHRRLERIAQLLGPDWQEPARALELQLALRLQRVFSSLHDPQPAHTP
ncbi:helix-turn-helix domain-containing protein [Streptomyces kebangsaanensis]|uniref:Helix-turn-helix domain-containing protein n=1 Tax=Streptomyces kebangsaanensis TaxID=864058 RepID=A0ABW6KVS6_9ACTN